MLALWQRHDRHTCNCQSQITAISATDELNVERTRTTDSCADRQLLIPRGHWELMAISTLEDHEVSRLWWSDLTATIKQRFRCLVNITNPVLVVSSVCMYLNIPQVGINHLGTSG